MEYYIYKIICLMDEWNGKFYIGKHYGKVDDAYTGSGKLIKEYFSKYGKVLDKTYVKEIIDYGTEDNICDLERDYIREGMKSELCLNMICNSGKSIFGQKHSEDSRKKMSEAKEGQNNPMHGKKHLDGTRKKISESLKGRVSPNKGKTLSNEQKRKMSESLKGRVVWNKGKHLSDEARRKISESLKKRSEKRRNNG